MSSRRLLAFISRLPPDSHTAEAVLGYRPYSRQEHLLADIRDLLLIQDWHFVCAHSEKGEAPDPPELPPRPGEDSDSTPAGKAQSHEQSVVVVDHTNASEALSNFLAFVPPDQVANAIRVTPAEG